MVKIKPRTRLPRSMRRSPDFSCAAGVRHQPSIGAPFASIGGHWPAGARQLHHATSRASYKGVVCNVYNSVRNDVPTAITELSPVMAIALMGASPP